MNIPISIKKALIDKHKKQKDLAANLNVTASFLSAVSNGKKLPSLDFILKCALFFDMKLSEFIALGEE